MKVMDGIMYFVGTRRILMMKGMNATAMISVTMFARKSDAIVAHANSGELVKSRGPGCRPHTISAERSIPVTADPGMPNASKGAKAPAQAELLAASAAAMPSIAPVPRGSLLLKNFCIV